MKCDLSKEKLVGYFYQDLPEDDKKDVAIHLKKCAACKKELQEFSKTAELLKTWPDEEPNLNLKFIHEKASFWSWLKPDWSVGLGWQKIAVGFVAGLALALIILSALNFEASYSNGDFSVKLSLLPRSDKQAEPPEDPLAVPVTRREFNSWKQDSYQLIQKMIRDTETRNRQDYQLALREFARDVDYQRRQDLWWVGRGFQMVHSVNENKIRQTNEVLEHLIQTAKYQIPQWDSGINK